MKLAFFLLMLVVGEDLCEHVTVSALSQRHAHTIRIGTRPSPLAKIQARTVSEALQRISSESNHELKIEIVEIGTTGDMSRASASTQNLPLAVKSVDFTGALDQALLSHEIDAAVHSLKDIPPTSRWCDDLKISCCLPREDPMDVLVSTASSNNSMYFSILGLPKGSRIGTSSVRRQAQILSIRNDLELVNLRGNVEHRLDALRSGKIHSLILASAGLNRLMANGNDDAFRDLKWQNLSPDEMLSGACQGIIGVATRTSDTATSEWLRRIDDENASIAAAAERSFLNTLDAFRPSNYLRHNEKDNPSTVWTGRPPLAVLMTKEIEEGQENSKRWILQGMLACPDGSKILRSGLSTPSKIVSINEAKELGKACGKTILEKAGPNFYQE